GAPAGSAPKTRRFRARAAAAGKLTFMSSLFEAVASGDPEAVVVALEAGDDVNALGEGGTTPLIQAAKLGHADLVELLLEAGAVAFLKDDEQETALLKAAANGHHDCCELLFDHAEEEE